MEQNGHKVVWTQETHSLLNDLILVWRNKPDVVFIPNLNLSAHLLLLLLSSIKILNIPIFAYLHREPRYKSGIKGSICKLLLFGVTHLFFLSEKTMEETLKHKQAKPECCSVPGWGADLNYYTNVRISDNGYFVSTGKENRDFDILIEAFKNTGAPLKIITAKEHAGSDYQYLIKRCENIPNIDVMLIENTDDAYKGLLDVMAEAHALVCPLQQDKLTYCVGLSSIVDAEALHKPLIITANPYHSKERMRDFKQVTSLEEWELAIKNILPSTTRDINEFSMQKAYENMMLKIMQ